MIVCCVIFRRMFVYVLSQESVKRTNMQHNDRTAPDDDDDDEHLFVRTSEHNCRSFDDIPVTDMVATGS